MAKGYYRQYFGDAFCDYLIKTAVLWYDVMRKSVRLADAFDFAERFTNDLVKSRPDLVEHRGQIAGYIYARFAGPLRVPLYARVEAARWLNGLGRGLPNHTQNQPVPPLAALPAAVNSANSTALITTPTNADSRGELTISRWKFFPFTYTVREIQNKGAKPRLAESLTFGQWCIFERLV